MLKGYTVCLSPSGSRPGIMYDLPKVHKKCINGSPPFHPIFSAIDTSAYNLAQFLVTLLSPLTYNVKHSFTFVEDIRSQDQNLYITTVDVDSLFTNLQLDETNRYMCCYLKILKPNQRGCP